jgi:hypothetical protein
MTIGERDSGLQVSLGRHGAFVTFAGRRLRRQRPGTDDEVGLVKRDRQPW